MPHSSRSKATKRPTSAKKEITTSREKVYNIRDVAKVPMRLMLDPDYFWYTAALLLVGELFLNLFIIQKVSYTEIDWVAYMQEVGGFLAGERDYVKLKGDTGPLVYPAGFVWVYSGLYYLTDSGTNIQRAQYIFAAIYLATQLVVFSIYRASKRIPPIVLVFLCTSKRLHSIYVLRCFNDPIAMLLLYCAVLAMVHRQFRVASILFSLGVSVKMNILLFFPAFGLLLWKAEGAWYTLANIASMFGLQRLIAWPFLKEHSASYLSRAFDFGRVFEYKWTVNWRLVDEQTFVSKDFAGVLLACHVFVLLTFLSTKWCRKEEGGVFGVFQRGFKGTTPVSTDEIILTMFTCNLIGIMFARSLHYQFYSWYFHTLPYLVWQSEWEGTTYYTTIAKGLLIATIEGCWLAYPSTWNSSAALLACHILILSGVWRSRSSAYQKPKWLEDEHKD
ncbi:dolichyl-P-Man:Man(5)GlcNAc(2)-PP-dolichol alpha-1,3-mannosyltransferase [Umbelopsis sp. WA50703]